MIGLGPCGLGCRGCCLMNTVRQMLGTWNHILYDNGEKFWKDTRRWLADAGRRPTDVLGLGAHHSDSLLYEGVTGHARHVVPMFASPETNPQGCKLRKKRASRLAVSADDVQNSCELSVILISPRRIARPVLTGTIPRPQIVYRSRHSLADDGRPASCRGALRGWAGAGLAGDGPRSWPSPTSLPSVLAMTWLPSAC